MKSIKRLIVLAGILVLVPSGSAWAACGIGTGIWEGNDGTGAKILAFTTNFWTFKAISTTFEVSGCGPGDNIFKQASADTKVRVYASQNLDHLAEDMAQGRGEHVDVVTHLLALPTDHSVVFRSLVQQNFAALFPHDHVTSEEMLLTLKSLMAASDVLSRYVES